MRSVEFHTAIQALEGSETSCGDIAYFLEEERTCKMSLIDVLGHGIAAHNVSIQALDFLKQADWTDLVTLMNQLHHHLTGTRGAVAALCVFHKESGLLQFVGIGNITVKHFGKHKHTLVARDAVIGISRIIRPKLIEVTLEPGDILVMHSDGIRENFNRFECQHVLQGNAEEIAYNIMTNCSRRNDDSSCVVMKYLP